ncbi:MAG: bacteriohemerythrin [Sulfuritalea sp.]|jgi:hemerythrin|nr:bacteriohemerythrin [Sulfuritalea sp.]
MAQLLEWTPDLSVGIDVIDAQHKRIVEYINQLHEARIHGDKDAIARVIEELVDYTLSHFSFEESMMEEAHYRFLAPHKKVHELFVRRVGEYQQRFKMGEDVATVAGDMQNTLVTWLMNHIRREDMDYGPTVRASLGEDKLKQASAKKSGWLSRFFGA